MQLFPAGGSTAESLSICLSVFSERFSMFFCGFSLGQECIHVASEAEELLKCFHSISQIFSRCVLALHMFSFSPAVSLSLSLSVSLSLYPVRFCVPSVASV